MPSTKYPNLAKDLRKYGLKVVEVKGWQTRSANWSKGFSPRAIVCHHTAGPRGSNAPSLKYIVDGPSIAPLAQFVLGRDGTVYIVTGHRANHAGVGGPYRGIPANVANSYAWGIEAENDGRGEKWPAAQMNAYYKLAAALMHISGIKDVNMVFGHKEWSPGRKIDPLGINMNTFRKNVSKAYNSGTKKPAKAPAPSGSYTVKSGDTLWDIANANRTTVQAIKKINGLRSDVIHPGQKLIIPGKKAAPVTPTFSLREVASVFKKARGGQFPFGKEFKAALAKEVGGGVMNLRSPRIGLGTKRMYKKWQEKLGYRGKDADGVPGEVSLKKFAARHGFKVTK